MYINGVKIPYNVADTKENQKFSLAFQEVAYLARVNESKLTSGEMSEKKFKKKQIKLIENFFTKVSNEEVASKLFATCKGYDDYVRAFGNCAKTVSTASVLLRAVKSKNVKNKTPKRRTKKKNRARR